MVKVVQLTDTHLFEASDGRQKGIDTQAALTAVVADVVNRHPDLDALLLTGDLSDDQTPASYARLKRLLGPLGGAPIYAIPGNHDDLATMREVLVDLGISVLEDAHLGNWRIAMLNSQVPGQVHGKLGEVQRDRLQASLREAGEPVMVALHHPPIDMGSAWIDGSRCRDGDALLAGIGNTSVKVVVCGHVHQQFETRHHDISILTTPSTCVQFAPGCDAFSIDHAAAPGYRIFELHPDGRWSSTVARVGIAP